MKLAKNILAITSLLIYSTLADPKPPEKKGPKLVNAIEKEDGFNVAIEEATLSLIGTKPKAGDSLIVHYTGFLEGGKIFDSSRERNAPFEFTIGTNQVVPCWEEGFMHFSKL